MKRNILYIKKGIRGRKEAKALMKQAEPEDAARFAVTLKKGSYDALIN